MDNYKLGYHINLPFIEEVRKVYVYNDITLIKPSGKELNPELITKYDVKEVIGDYEVSDTAKRIFETQYQQNPQPTVGQLMKLTHFRYYTKDMLNNTLFTKIFITIDSASKTKEHNDYSVMCCWAATRTHLYLLDMLRGKWEGEELASNGLNFYYKWQKGLKRGVGCNKIIIEDASAGTGLIQSWKKLFPSYMIKPLKRSNDKSVKIH